MTKRRTLDEMEAQMRAMGLPDIEEWRRRAQARQDAYERQPWHRRLRWWISGKSDGIHADREIARRTREIEAEARAKFLRDHPEYADALRRGDATRAKALLSEIIAAEKVELWRDDSFARFLLSNLREHGFAEGDLADVREMLDNMRRERRDN